MLTPTQKIKLLLNITDDSKDTLIEYLYESACNDYKALTAQSTTTGAEDLIVKMSVVKYNLLGEEGLSSQTVSGVTESIEGYGPDLTRAILCHRRLRVV